MRNRRGGDEDEMDESELNQLQNPDNWDTEHIEVHPPAKAPRVVVSVSFPRRDYEKVARCAKELDARVSEFIRDAAVERACAQRLYAEVSSVTHSTAVAIFMEKPPSATRVRAPLRLLGQFMPDDERTAALT